MLQLIVLNMLNHYYTDQLNGYQRVLNAIKGNTYQQFEYNKNSVYSLLYEDYLNTLEEYQFNYDNALATHEYYANGGVYGDNSGYQEEILNEQIALLKTQIEAYEYFEDSVKNNENKFDEDRDSNFYSYFILKNM